MESVDRAASVFGNEIDEKTYHKACRSQQKYALKYGDDSTAGYHLVARETPVIGKHLGVRNLQIAPAGAQALDIAEDAASIGGAPVVIGNIRMGFGHYRIAMAFASAAHALGYVPYWFDLSSLEGTTASKVIGHQNKLYSMGSRLSQKVGLFDKLYWEPMNSEGFRKLTYNAPDQKNAELMVPVFADLPEDVPYIGTHVWPSQAAVHAGLTHVVNAIPDNWPMALHLAEGSLHTVQTPSAMLGYKVLRGMDKERTLNPMPKGSILNVGHYIDHELVANIEADCAARRIMLTSGAPVRYLLTVGGAGAQAQLFEDIINTILPLVSKGEAALMVNFGDHAGVWNELLDRIPEMKYAVCHFEDFEEASAFATESLNTPMSGIHAFFDPDIFSAVYITNLLMRCCDVLVTKPSELAFYPVPKLMIHRVGGHEAWGAIRTAELGDGTYELETADEVCQMIGVLQNERELICQMCDHIEAANQIGIYDGAYKVVKLAVVGGLTADPGILD